MRCSVMFRFSHVRQGFALRTRSFRDVNTTKWREYPAGDPKRSRRVQSCTWKSLTRGRPFNYAAAVAGEAGVTHAIRLLQEEIDRNMAMVGANGCGELTSDLLIRRR